MECDNVSDSSVAYKRLISEAQFKIKLRTINMYNTSAIKEHL